MASSAATELDDAEFWLPSHFLTDDDILSDFGFGSSSDMGSLSTETSDDDDSKPNCLSTSPQSTLFGFGSTRPGSSHGSLTGPLQQTGGSDKDEEETATLDLLNKAAGEVAKMNLTKTIPGTGFFDCSNGAKGLLCPPPLPQFTHPHPPPPFYSHPHFPRFPPHMMRGAIQIAQNRGGMKNNSNSNSSKNNGSNRPLGLPPSAWPALPGQTQPETQAQAQPVMGMFVNPQTVGTGVFLPRGVTTPSPHPKKKSEGKSMKTKNNKPRPTKANAEAIGLPSEWVY